MWYGYFSFLEYLELRRRVENRLAKTNRLAYHAIAFLVVLLVTLCRTTLSAVPAINYAMTAWSLVLLAHAIWTYRHSGASSNVRSLAIETEVRQRLTEEGGDLVDDERDLFRLHEVLNEDVKFRAGLVTTLMVFTAINALFWFFGALDTRPSVQIGWIFSMFLTVICLLIVAIGAQSRARHEKRLMSQLSRTLAAGGMDKPKREGEKEKHVRLTDDGELVEVADDDTDSSANPHPDKNSRGAAVK